MKLKINPWRVSFFGLLAVILVISALFMSMVNGKGVNVPDRYSQTAPSEFYNDLKNLVDILPYITKSINREEFDSILKQLKIQENIIEYVNSSDTLDKSISLRVGDLIFRFNAQGNLILVDRLYLNRIKDFDLTHLKKPFFCSYIFGGAFHGVDLLQGGTPMFGGFLLILAFFVGVIFYILGEFKYRKLRQLNLSIYIFILINFVGFLLMYFRFYTHQTLLTNELFWYYPDISIPVLIGGLRQWLIFPSFLFDIIVLNFISLIIVLWRKSILKKNAV